MSGLFAPPPSSTARDPGYQALFVQLKAVCVPLLHAATGSRTALGVASAQQRQRILHLLGTLRQILTGPAVRPAFTPALANYVFFPLSSLLAPPAASRDDAVLEATMLALEPLVNLWRRTQSRSGSGSGSGMDPRVRVELWIMTILTLGGPLDPNKPAGDLKGKGKGAINDDDGDDNNASEEARLAMVRVLLALMRPDEPRAAPAAGTSDQDDDPLGEHLDWSRIDPPDPPGSPDQEANPEPEPSPPSPILFHTLTTLLSLASEPTSLLPLQLSALDALRLLIRHYLAVGRNPNSNPNATSPSVEGGGEGPPPLLATSLPGTASTLSRIATSRPPNSAAPGPSRNQNRRPQQASVVVVAALDTLALLITSTLSDAVTEPLRHESRTNSVGLVVGAEASRSSASASASSSARRVTSLEDLVKTVVPAGDTVPMEIEPLDDGSDPAVAPPPPPAGAPDSGAPAAPSSPPVGDGAGADTAPKGPVTPTSDWLRYTLSSLEMLFGALSPLAAHESPVVRGALVRFLDSVLTACGTTLGRHAEVPLEGLLTLAGDEWRDQVAEPARAALGRALARQQQQRPRSSRARTRLQPEAAASDPDVFEADTDDAGVVQLLVSRIVQRRFATLPGAVRRRDEPSVRRSADIVRVGLSLFLQGIASGQHPRATAAADVHILRQVEKWSWNLLSALELERVAASVNPGREGGGGGGGGGMALAWITGDGRGGGLEASGSEQQTSSSYPPTRLRGLSDEATVRSLDQLWRALGQSADSSGAGGGGGMAESVVEHLLGFALGPRRYEPIAASSLWALDGILVGIGLEAGRNSDTGSSSGSSSKEQRRLFRKVARALIALLDHLHPGDLDSPTAAEERKHRAEVPAGDDVTELQQQQQQQQQRVEHRSGVLDLPSLDAYKPVATREAAEQDRATQRVLLTSWSLRLLATCAELLGAVAFQPLLMQALYHVLEHSSPTSHPFVVAHAHRALAVISDSVGYASPQNLVLANVDYVVNSVSQRLAAARLDPSAPLVLVEMIRLVGKPIVPMVQDLVDDVFEALDDYHGYDEVTVGLWAVLDALLKVMQEDVPEFRPRATRRVTVPQASEAEWQELDVWLRERAEEAKRRHATVPNAEENVNPRRPFKRGEGPEAEPAAPDAAAAGAAAQTPPEFPSDQVAPPTRAQVVTAQILSKAVYFLSHESPFLRARVLSLIASAVPLLSLPDLDAADPTANRASDLMPVVHRAWPYILNRLNDPEPYVVVEAAGLVESLSRNVGEFMSRRIVDDVWPRFKTLLGRLDVEDRKSALSTQDRHATSYRIYRSILQTLVYAAKEVPLKEDVLWEQAVAMRRFLSTKYHVDLQDLASSLYRALGCLNPDLVWLVLGGTIRSDPSLPRHLAMDERLVGENVRRLLVEI